MRKSVSVLTGLIVAMAAVALLFTAGQNTKSVSAETPHTHCVCGGNVDVINNTDAEGHAQAVATHGACDATQVWTAWSTAGKLPTTSGYYYLTTDLTISGVQTMSETNGASIHICLNGHKVLRTNSSSEANAATENQTLKFILSSKTADWAIDICDCSEGQQGGFEYAEGKVHHQSNNDGMTFFQYYSKGTLNLYCANIGQATMITTEDKCGAINISNGSTLNMYSGIFNGSKLYDDYTFKTAVGYAGAIQVNDGGVFNLFGGTIQNGLAKQDGNIRVRGTMNMYGGEIKDGTSASGAGGNVGLFSYSSLDTPHEFNMYGGKISGGSATSNGGNVRVYGHAGTTTAYDSLAVFNMYGGEISGGKAVQGGNISLVGTSATCNSVKYFGYSQMTITGGKITGGTATSNGGNIYARGYKGAVNNVYQSFIKMTGGTIENGTAPIGGNVEIGYGSNPFVFIQSGGTIKNGTATNYGGNVAINLSSKFILEDGLVSGGTVNSTLNGSPSYNSTDKAKSVNVQKGFGGNIGVYGNAEVDVMGGTVENGTVSATGSGYAMGGNIGAVSMINSSGSQLTGAVVFTGGLIKNGKVVSTSTATNDRSVAGGNVCIGGPISWYMDGSMKLLIYGGTFTFDVEDGAKHTSYGVYYNGDKTVNVFGGNIFSNGASHTYSPGSSYTINGKTYKGGDVLISNGYAYSKTSKAYGGNYYNLNAGRTFTNMTFENGIAEGATDSYGGNIYLGTDTVSYTMSGCTLTGGYANNGGNVYTGAKSLTLKNKTVLQDGTAKKQGGNLYLMQNVNVTCTMEDTAVITRGCAETSTAGNVMCSGKFTMNGGEISYGEATGSVNVFVNIGNNVEEKSTRGIFTMNGGVIKDGVIYNGGQYGYGSGANVGINGNQTNASYYNAQFILNGGEIIMSGEKFIGKDGKEHVYGENGNGSNIMNNGYFEMNGGTVSGGKAMKFLKTGSTTEVQYYGQGGALCLAVSTKDKAEMAGHRPHALITGGTITGGSCQDSGGNICLSAYSEMEITGGVIKNGTHYSGDNSIPNIAVYGNAELLVTGGVMTVNDSTKENSIWAKADAVMDISGASTYVQKMYIQTDNKVTFLHGGYVEKVPADRCFKTGYSAVLLDTPIVKEGVTFKYEICQAHVLSTTSFVVDETGAKISSGIATVTGGGNVKNGTGKTITASEVDGYSFIGWAKLTALDADTYTAINGATALSYTTEGTTDDEFYAALYKAAEKKVHYEVKGNATVEGLENSGDVLVGTSITIKYSGSKTLNAFTNEVNKVVGTSTTLTLTLYTDTVIIAVEKADNTSATELVFLTESQQIYMTLNTLIPLTELPEVPVHYGKEGGFWSLTENGEEATLADINALIPTEASVTVYLTGYTGKTPTEELTASDEAQVSMTFADKTYVNDKYTVSFGVTRLIPEGCTVVEQGVLICTNATSLDDAKTKLVFGGQGIGKLRGVNTENSGVTSTNIQNIPEGFNVYGIGYVVYLKSGSSTPELAYSDVALVSTVVIY